MDEWDQVHDLIVVGSGAGALTGAYVAARQGLDTVVLEKTGFLGGTSAYSGAACWLPGTEVQQRDGVADSTESARTYLRAVLGEQMVEHQEAFLTHAPDLVRLLEQDPAIEFRWRAFPDYFAAPGRLDLGRSFMPRSLPQEALGDLVNLVRPPVECDRLGQGHPEGPLTAGRALIGRLLLAFTSTGHGSVSTGSCVDRLVVEDGRVVGVEATTAEGRVRMRARGGVLLAAGGFERNAGLREKYHVPGSADWSMAPAATSLGEPLEAAIAVGADTDLTEQAWWCPGLLQPGGEAAFTLGFHGGLVVDGDGRRYANESLPYDQMGRQMSAAANRVPSYLVFDSRFGGAAPAISIPTAEPEAQLAAGTWVTAPDLEGLAAGLGLPPLVLAQTVERFNDQARSGVDADHHRGEDPYDLFFAHGAGPNPALVEIDRPPYYAARMVLADLGTKGGLRTDTLARVLGTNGEPITGLYAAGNTSASMTGAFYPGPGIPIGTAMVFAYLAVQHVLAHGDVPHGE